MQNNCLSITKQLLKRLNVKFTEDFLKESINSHPDHPSLLSITDTLDKFKINNAAVLLKMENINEIPLPAIVQLKEFGETYFYILDKVENDKLILLNDLRKKNEISYKKFENIWTGVSLLLEINNESKQPNIKQKLKDQRFSQALVSLVSLLILSVITLALLNSDSQKIISILGLTLLKLSGIVVGVLLLWYEIDKYSLTIQSFCRDNGVKTDCNAVLNSKYASFADGKISLGSVVFGYFLSSFILLLFSKFSESALFLSAAISYFTILVVLLSAYVQKFKIKQWCKFCLIVQAIILVESLLLSLIKPPLYLIKIEEILFITTSLTFFIVSWFFLKPIIQKSKQLSIYKHSLTKIKLNKRVFNSLLENSSKIKNSAEGIGIFLTNPNAKYNVIKVCNPYCGPCAKSHPILEELYERGSINLQIIFTASNNLEDPKMLPVNHLMAIENAKDLSKTKKALNVWYQSEDKDYLKFKKKFPLKREKKQGKRIADMFNWCEKEKIKHTPTVFINGFELPREYNISDLPNLLE